MRILFFGGKNVGYGCLEYLINSGEDIVGVIINDNELSRDKWFKSVAELSKQNNIPVFLPKNVNDPSFVQELKVLKPDMGIVVYYDKILKSNLIDIVPQGFVNLHMALAEEYRGCFPTTWTIINGEKKTGVTLHYITEDIDAGPIIAQTELAITDIDTGESLYYKCTSAGIQLFKDTFPFLKEGKIKAREQVTTIKTKYYKRKFPSHDLDIKNKCEELYNNIRALTFSNFPRPYFFIGNRKYVIIPEDEK